MDFKAIRKEYENTGIDEAQIPSDPIQLFREWYETAVEKCPGSWLEPNAMSLATTDLDGNVSNRYVLMKQVEDNGIQFFTNYDSYKSSQILANPKAAVAFHWPYLGRQVRIEGAVEKTTKAVSEAYFHSRPRGSQISAVSSKQSTVVESRQLLDDQRARLEEQYDGMSVPLPENWGGYLLKPSKIEFWQGRLDRLHDRIVFRFETEWNWQRLSP